MGTSLTRRLLSDFLKSRRARLSPRELGFDDPLQRRRTKGLRRSETAELAGVSADWYALLERGQQRALTHRVVEAVCRAFQLNDAERGYLHDLAFGAPTCHSENRLHPSIEFTVQHAREVGLIVLDAWLTVVRSNKIAQKLLLVRDDDEPLARNLLFRLFTDGEMRALAGPHWKRHASHHVGLFRRALARDPANAEAHAIVERLGGLPEFAEMWESQDVYSFDMYNKDNLAAGLVLIHPVFGTVALDTVALEAPGWPRAHICCLTPADDAGNEVFLTLSGAGRQ